MHLKENSHRGWNRGGNLECFTEWGYSATVGLYNENFSRERMVGLWGLQLRGSKNRNTLGRECSRICRYMHSVVVEEGVLINKVSLKKDTVHFAVSNDITLGDSF